jgi:hypothetical protein
VTDSELRTPTSHIPGSGKKKENQVGNKVRRHNLLHHQLHIAISNGKEKTWFGSKITNHAPNQLQEN